MFDVVKFVAEAIFFVHRFLSRDFLASVFGRAIFVPRFLIRFDPERSARVP